MKNIRGEKMFSLMPQSNRGISNVIVTLIMIVLVLVAVGIIWVSIQENLDSGTQQVELRAKCLNLLIDSTALTCSGASNGDCNATIKRSAGGEEIGGVKLVFTNSAGTENFRHDVQGNIEPLATITETNVATGLTNVSEVEVVPYFIGPSGEELLC
ncbi:MAG: archaellin/type IV pilin N-terminal domain-containing protein [Candidatus Pacearchaeota archaeon]